MFYGKMCSTEAHYGYQYFWYGLVFITLVNCQAVPDSGKPGARGAPPRRAAAPDHTLKWQKKYYGVPLRNAFYFIIIKTVYFLLSSGI